MEEVRGIQARLEGVPDPVGFLAGLFAHAPVGLQIFRTDGTSFLTNAAFRALFGSEPPPDYSAFRDELVAQRGLADLIRRAFAGETLTTPPFWYDPRDLTSVKASGGRRVFIEATFFPLRGASNVIGYVAAVFRDLTAETVAAERTSALLKVASALGEVASTQEVAEAILAGAMSLVGASGGAVAILDESRRQLGLYNSRGYAAAVRDQFSEVSLDADLPMPEAVRTRKTIWLKSVAELRQRYPALVEAQGFLEGARLALPLLANGRAVGCIGLTLPHARELDDSERVWLETLSRLCAQAFERARFSDARAREAEDAAERARFVASASKAFSESLNLGAVLKRVTDACVPRLADYAFVDLERPDGTYERIASACKDVDRAAILAEIGARYTLRAGSGQPGMRAIRLRGPVLVTDFEGDGLKAYTLDDANADLVRRLGTRSVLALPLLARGAPIGAISLGFYTAGRQHGRDEIALGQDLAHRAALAVDAARLYAEAQRAILVREDFLSIAGHELKTPLTALSLQLQALRRRIDKPGGVQDGPRILASVEVIERQVSRLTTLVRQLLDVSRLAAGRLELELDRFDLVELSREVAARFEGEQARGGSALELAVPRELVGTWDLLRLDQVLTNLLSNAFRYGQGKPVRFELEAAAGKALIRVRDQGVGIAEADQQRIFKRFERAASTRNYGGVGLGLWIVHELVTASGGTVSVVSALGQGSTFTVELPLGN